MSAYTPGQLSEIRRLHAMWLRREDGGKRADLCEADLRGADLYVADLREADLRADLCEADLCEANLCEADLCEADLCEADLRAADLRGADLRGADLREANLCEADLCEADLRGANLYGADLRGADLREAIGVVLGPQRSDGYLFWLTHDGTDYRARAGCRDFALAEARQHWAETRGGTPLGDETMAILDYLEARAPSMILPKREVAK